jgi:hypothetical protein
VAGLKRAAEGWLGLKNGPLLEAMVERQLSVLITGDRMLYRERRRRPEYVMAKPSTTWNPMSCRGTSGASNIVQCYPMVTG